MHFTRSYDNQWIRTRQRGTVSAAALYLSKLPWHNHQEAGTAVPASWWLFMRYIRKYIHFFGRVRENGNDYSLESCPAVTYIWCVLLGLSALVDFSSPAFIKGYTTKERDLSWSIAYSGRLTSHPSSNRHSVTVKEYLVCYHFAVAFFAVLCV